MKWRTDFWKSSANHAVWFGSFSSKLTLEFDRGQVQVLGRGCGGRRRPGFSRPSPMAPQVHRVLRRFRDQCRLRILDLP